MPVNRKRPTLKDVAREAGVSLGMASRVMGKCGSFSEATAQRVRTAAKKLDYRANAAARSLESQSTRFVGLSVDSLDGYFWTSLVRGSRGYLPATSVKPVASSRCGGTASRRTAD
jgi:LacI family transcriptional regulator